MINIASITAQLRFLRALRSRPFALLWVGLSISTLGDSVYNIALAWEVLLLTGSGTAMGLVLAATSVPQLLFLLIGGVAADRFSRRLVLLWSDVGRGVTVFAIAVMGWLNLLQAWELVIMGLIFGFVNGFCVPAYYAIQPQLVEKADLPSANALNDLTGRLAFLLGPLLGAGLISWVGPASAFAFDGLTFVASTLCLLILRLPEPSEIEISPIVLTQTNGTSQGTASSAKAVLTLKGISNSVKDVWADTREGLVYVAQSKWLWISILIASIANMGILGSLDVALPRLVHDMYNMGIWAFGEIGVAGTLGSIAGVLLIGQILRLHRRGLLAYIAIMSAGAGLVLFGLPLPLPPLWILVIANIASVLVGLGLGAFGVLWTTLLQDFVPGDRLGRVSSIDAFGSFSLTPLAYGLAGILTDITGPGRFFIFSGLLLLALAFTALGVRDIRQLQ